MKFIDIHSYMFIFYFCIIFASNGTTFVKTFLNLQTLFFYGYCFMVCSIDMLSWEYVVSSIRRNNKRYWFGRSNSLHLTFWLNLKKNSNIIEVYNFKQNNAWKVNNAFIIFLFLIYVYRVEWSFSHMVVNLYLNRNIILSGPNRIQN